MTLSSFAWRTCTKHAQGYAKHEGHKNDIVLPSWRLIHCARWPGLKYQHCSAVLTIWVIYCTHHLRLEPFIALSSHCLGLEGFSFYLSPASCLSHTVMLTCWRLELLCLLTHSFLMAIAHLFTYLNADIIVLTALLLTLFPWTSLSHHHHLSQHHIIATRLLYHFWLLSLTGLLVHQVFGIVRTVSF